MVAATERGVCAVTLGNDEVELAQKLRGEYPQAEISRGGIDLGAFLDAVVRQINGSEQAALPLDAPGSRFQRRVWKALLQIPSGATRTYGQIAARIGAPTASRAVARACAQNRVAVLIPCHRVVRSDGELGGYRWGADRKRRLLKVEQSQASARAE